MYALFSVWRLLQIRWGIGHYIIRHTHFTVGNCLEYRLVICHICNKVSFTGKICIYFGKIVPETDKADQIHSIGQLWCTQVKVYLIKIKLNWAFFKYPINSATDYNFLHQMILFFHITVPK